MWVRVGQRYINMDNVTHVVDLVDPPELRLYTTVTSGEGGNEAWGPDVIFLHGEERRAMLKWLDRQDAEEIDSAENGLSDNETRIKDALSVAYSDGQVDGAHHKAWVIDQMVQALLGSEEAYQQWRQEYQYGDGEEYEWFEGIAP